MLAARFSVVAHFQPRASRSQSRAEQSTYRSQIAHHSLAFVALRCVWAQQLWLITSRKITSRCSAPTQRHHNIHRHRAPAHNYSVQRRMGVYVRLNLCCSYFGTRCERLANLNQAHRNNRRSSCDRARLHRAPGRRRRRIWEKPVGLRLDEQFVRGSFVTCASCAQV